jgi:hypothetical protein
MMWPKPKRQERMKGYQKTADGYGSKLEAAVGRLLELRERAGEIRNIKRQVSLVLQDGPREEKITWKVDFSFEDAKTGETCYAEAKGFETEVYRLKLKLFRAKPHGRCEIWKGTYARPRLEEIIEPK